MALIMTAIVFASCENLNPICDTEKSHEITISASLPDSPTDTKSEIAEIVGSTVKYTWLQGDAINVFFGASESSRFVTNTAGKVAQFKGTVGVVTGGGDDLNDDTSLWGVYPYDENTICDGSSVTISLPHIQEAKADNFADDLFPSVARSQNFTMAFYPVCGGFRFRVSNPDIVKVTLSGNNNEVLAGKANVSMALGQTPQVTEISEGQTELVMFAPDGGCFETDKYYYFVLYPTDFSKGYTLTYYKKGTMDSFVKQEAYPIQRNKFGGKTDGDKDLSFSTSWDDGSEGEIERKNGDYIDEYGINHGGGTEIDGLIWAPVNCGYHKELYPWGKLYQWGRLYGQGYNDGEYMDASSPQLEDKFVSDFQFQSKKYENTFFLGVEMSCFSYETYYPVTTDVGYIPIGICEPCPEGWRLPSIEELESLCQNQSPWTVNNGLTGYWYTGSAAYSDRVARVFLPTAGMRTSNGLAIDRSNEGYYLSSYSLLYGGYYLLDLPYAVYMLSEANSKYTTDPAGNSIRCVRDATDKDIVYITDIALNESSITIEAHSEKRLSATIYPADASDKRVVWDSSNHNVATITNYGLVRAISEGEAIISATSGNKTVYCNVSVIPRSYHDGDYVDEYGINHGPGVEINSVVWAPVNCGYHEENFPYGKYYQWGRRFGQGSKAETIDGPVSLYDGQSEQYADFTIYTSWDVDSWLSTHDKTLWYIESNGVRVKTEYDPCPEGWIVPEFKHWDYYYRDFLQVNESIYI